MNPSKSASRMQSPIIRELLELAGRKGVISLAGGVPSSEVFPMEELKEASAEALEVFGVGALQYSPTEGLPRLRELVAERFGVGPEWVLITSGSQQVIDLFARAYLDEGERVAVEAPTYLGALLAFAPHAPRYLPLPTDEEGLIPEALPKGARFLYLLPNFQNPSGALLAEDRREAVARWAQGVGALVLEDDPYAHIYFEGPPPASVFSRARENVVYAGTFSKLIAPGLRVGYAVARPEVISTLAQVKQAADLHTSSLAQAVIVRLIEKGVLGPQAERVRSLYRRRRDAMVEAVREFLGERVRYSVPKGGMFLWIRLPEGTDEKALLERALEEGVAFVPGAAFFPEGGYPAARLTFASVPEEEIVEGVRRLARALEDAGP